MAGEAVPGSVGRVFDITTIRKSDWIVQGGWSTSGPSSHRRFEFAEAPSER